MTSRGKDSKRPSSGKTPDDERELYRKGLQGDASLTSAKHDDTRGGRTAAAHDQEDPHEGQAADSRAGDAPSAAKKAASPMKQGRAADRRQGSASRKRDT